MMDRHLTLETVEKLRRGELPAEQVGAALRHIAGCADCAKLSAEQNAGEIARTQELLLAEAQEPPRHLDEGELFGWVDGTLDDAAREAVGAHMEDCALCREDAADLQRLRTRRRGPAPRLWLAAAAALAAVLITLLLMTRGRTAPPPAIVRGPSPVRQHETPRTLEANAQWTALVETALASGRLPFPPDLAALRGEADDLRGSRHARAATLHPAGVYVDEVTPRFTWPAVPGAAYVVTVLDGEEEVARSPELHETSWTPSRPLARGRTYLWQVEATRSGKTDVLPPAPAPPATFSIVRAADHDALAAARERRPDDALLLAVLAARAGLVVEANAQLARLAASPDPRVQRLRTSAR